MINNFVNDWIENQNSVFSLWQKNLENFYGVQEKIDMGRQMSYLEDFGDSISLFFQYLGEHPEKILDIQESFINQQGNILDNLENKDFFFKDKRFKSEEWLSNPFYIYIHQSYLNLKEQTMKILKNIESDRPDIYLKTRFYLTQLIDSLSPANFMMSNPDILKKLWKQMVLILGKGLFSLLKI